MDLMQSFAGGAQAITDAEQSSQDYQSLIGSKEDLKSAYQQTSTTDPNTGKSITAEPFKVSSLAARMAASRGDLKSFELFNKQAQTYKQGDLVNQIKQLEIEDNKIEKAHQTISMMAGPEDLEKEIMRADNPLPQEQKMAILAKIKGFKEKPEDFQKFKEQLQESFLPAKEAVQARMERAKLAQKTYNDEETRKETALRDSNTAKYQAGRLAKEGKGGTSTEDKTRTRDWQTEDKIDTENDRYRQELERIESKQHLDPKSKAAQIAKLEKDHKTRVKQLEGRLSKKPEEPEKPKPFDTKQLANVPVETKQELLEAIKADGKVAEESFDKYHGVGAARAIVDEDRSKPKKGWFDNVFGGTATPKTSVSNLPRASKEQIAEDEKKKNIAAEASKIRIADKKKQTQDIATQQDAQKVKEQKDEEIATFKRKLESLQQQLEAAKSAGKQVRIDSLNKQIAFVKKQINQ